MCKVYETIFWVWNVRNLSCDKNILLTANYEVIMSYL